jgi:hypothetical protein
MSGINELDGFDKAQSTFAPGDDTVGDVVDLHAYPGPKMPSLEPHRAAVLGEFGGLGLSIPRHLWVEKGNDSYVMFAGSADLGRKYRTLIDSVRVLKSRGLAAAIYTQVSDVEIEVNGLMTYDRAVVKLPADIGRVNAALYGADDPAEDAAARQP